MDFIASRRVYRGLLAISFVPFNSQFRIESASTKDVCKMAVGLQF